MSISVPFIPNTFIFEFFFNDINIDIADYADDTSPYPYHTENEKSIRLLEKNIDKLFSWFSYNFLNAHPDKCHLLMGNDVNVTLKIKFNQKLLGKIFDKRFDFNENVTSLCRKPPRS